MQFTADFHNVKYFQVKPETTVKVDFTNKRDQ